MLTAIFLAVAIGNGVQDCRANVVPEFGTPTLVFGVPIPVDGAAINLKCSLKD